jgi:hypothetical protein
MLHCFFGVNYEQVFWAEENPHVIAEQHMNMAPGIMVWAAIHSG